MKNLKNSLISLFSFSFFTFCILIFYYKCFIAYKNNINIPTNSIESIQHTIIPWRKIINIKDDYIVCNKYNQEISLKNSKYINYNIFSTYNFILKRKQILNKKKNLSGRKSNFRIMKKTSLL